LRKPIAYILERNGKVTAIKKEKNARFEGKLLHLHPELKPWPYTATETSAIARGDLKPKKGWSIAHARAVCRALFLDWYDPVDLRKITIHWKSLYKNRRKNVA